MSHTNINVLMIPYALCLKIKKHDDGDLLDDTIVQINTRIRR